MADSKFGPEFDRIHDELIELHWSWQNFHHLYMDSSEDEKLFRELAEGFSIIVNFMLGNAVVLAICRLTDPATQGKFSNLSFDRLRDVLTARVNSGTLSAAPAKLAAMSTKVDEINAAASTL